MNPNTSGIKTWQWVVTVIVVIVLIIIGVMIYGHKGSAPSDMSPVVENSNNPTTPGVVNRITMNDQYPGNVVFISSVQLAQGGWVVIQSDNAGQPGNVIGTQWSDAGINPVKVTLTTPTVDGGTYYAVLYSDNGDKTFSASTDAPLKDSAGNVIMSVFHASASVGAGLKG